MTNNNAKPIWYEHLKQPPLEKPYWTEEKKLALHNQLGESGGRVKKKSPLWRTVFAASAFAVAFVLFIIIWPNFKPHNLVHDSNVTVRQAYSSNGIKQWEVFPDGEARGGKTNGAAWMLYMPFDRLAGHTISISAVHLPTGMALDELKEMRIEVTDRDKYTYRSLDGETQSSHTRIVTDMALPLGGKWRFTMLLDGAFFGDAVIELAESDWELSSSFTSGSYTMTGVENKLGIINPGFIAGQGNKYMWHFWGKEEQITGKIIIYGINQSSGDLMELFKGRLYPGPLNGADASMPSSLTLPSAGKWKLIAVIDNRWFDSIVVQAN